MFPEIPIFIIYNQSHPLRLHHINQIINSPNKGPLWLGGWDQSSPDPHVERLALVWLLEKCTRSPAADGVPKGAGVAQQPTTNEQNVGVAGLAVKDVQNRRHAHGEERRFQLNCTVGRFIVDIVAPYISIL